MREKAYYCIILIKYQFYDCVFANVTIFIVAKFFEDNISTTSAAIKEKSFKDKSQKAIEYENNN